MSLFRKKKTLVRGKWSVFHGFLLFGLIVYALCLFLPLIWAVITAFKTQAEFRVNLFQLPKKWTWNFGKVYNEFYIKVNTATGAKYVGVTQMLINSLLYSFGCAFVGTLVPYVTSYLCARYKYKMSSIIYTVVIVVMALPIVWSNVCEGLLQADRRDEGPLFGYVFPGVLQFVPLLTGGLYRSSQN